MSRRTAAWLAWSLWAVAMVIGVLGHLLDALNGHLNSSPIVGTLTGIASLTVGALIVSRRPANRIGWLFLLTSLLLACGGAGNLADQYAYYTIVTHPGALPGGAWVLWLGVLAQILGYVPLVSFLLLLFPDGHLLSRRWRLVAWAAVAYIALIAGSAAFDPTLSNTSGFQVPNPLAIEFVRFIPIPSGVAANAFNAIAWILALGVLLLSVAAVILRYRCARGDERQQLKWFAFGALWVIIMGVVGVIGGLLNLTWLDNLPLFQLSVAAIPIVVGIAIFKYRLYDIDLIIRRTLLYSLLTGFLAAIYLGSVMVLQGAFTVLTGAARSKLVTVMSTLAIAALFVPLRRWLQAAIDRRFNRQKYDAAQTLAEFGASLRDDVNLEDLSARLLGVVDETMQPESVGLWLPKDER